MMVVIDDSVLILLNNKCVECRKVGVGSVSGVCIEWCGPIAILILKTGKYRTMMNDQEFNRQNAFLGKQVIYS